MRQLDYLFEKIENYKNRTDDIINIFLDAELAYKLAIENEENPDKKRLFEKKLNNLVDYKEKTGFNGMDLYELKECYREISKRSFRHKITFQGEHISKLKIIEYFDRLYQNIRYDLMNSVFITYQTGTSGKQPTDEGG